MRAYNLFRSRGANALICAVPEERSVPRFVASPRWQFRGRIDGERHDQGFDAEAAAASARFNGFYLYSDFQRQST